MAAISSRPPPSKKSHSRISCTGCRRTGPIYELLVTSEEKLNGGERFIAERRSGAADFTPHFLGPADARLRRGFFASGWGGGQM